MSAVAEHPEGCTNPPPDENLAPALHRLHDAIAALIDPQPRYLDTGRRTYLDSLYQQLTDAVSGQTGIRCGSKAGAPIWPEVHDLLVQIDATIRGWQPGPDTVTRLTTITETSYRPQDSKQLHRWATNLESWVKHADALLNPAPVVYLPDPCPVCGAETVETMIAGEVGHRRVLAISLDGARCAQCERLWRTLPELRVLGRMLGYHPSTEGIGS